MGDRNLWTLKTVFSSVISALVFFLAWEISAAYYFQLEIFPRPSEIICRVIAMKSLYAYHTWITAQEMFFGLLLAFLSAFSLACLMLSSELLNKTLQAIFVALQCLPMFTLAPMMILIFGWSKIAIILPTALMIFFPLTMSIYRGVSATPLALVEFFKIHQASSWKIFFSLRLPWAIPYIFSGLRVSAAIAGVGAVGGEWAGAQEGIGVLIQESRRNADFLASFGALFCLASLSLSFYLLTVLTERLIFKRYIRS